MSKHTPGPWWPMAGDIKQWGTGRRICAVYSHRKETLPEDETFYADLSLIAAAPDLLAALRGVVEFVATDGHALSMIPEDTWNNARLALKKATDVLG